MADLHWLPAQSRQSATGPIAAEELQLERVAAFERPLRKLRRQEVGWKAARKSSSRVYLAFVYGNF